MAASVEVKGADKLASTLREFSRSLDDLSDANRRAGEMVASAAVLRAPRRTGRLAGSSRTTTTPTTVDVSFGVVYAAPVHWGVGPRVGLRGPHNLPPTLFLTDALATQEDAVADVYLEAIDNRLGKVRGA